MKLTQLYFSPTGSTKKVVELLAGVWDAEKQAIDFSCTNKDYTTCTFARDELCFIGVPSFGGRVPAVALSHLQQMRAEGTPAVLVATYGNRDYDDTLLELKNAATQSGFQVIAAIAAVTEHSMMHQFGAGRPNTSDQQELLGFAEKIKQTIESGVALPEIAVKGNTPYREYGGLPFQPSADKNCNKCGICAKGCPTGAIPAEDPSDTHKGSCITCMRCVALCPQHARKLNPALLFVAGKKMQKTCAEPKANVLFFGDAP